ncbi:MAG: hypothetical protein ACM3NQ_21805 [Bacteroidales bacterium]
MNARRILFLVVIMLAVASALFAQSRGRAATYVEAATAVVKAEAPCSQNTIRGTYAFEFKGQTFQGGISPTTLPGDIPVLEGTLFPVAMTGVFKIGPDGKAEGIYSGLFGLVPLGYPDALPLTGTFTVHPDCTGEMVAPNGFGGTNTDKFVVLDNGREIRTVGISGAPFMWQMTLVRIGRADDSASMCGPNTLRGRYVMRCEGFEMASPGPPPAFVGVLPLFVVDVAANGTMTGRHYLRDQPVEGFAVTGQMTVNPDCTGQAIMETGALPGATVGTKWVYYDNGKEAFAGPILAFMGGKPVPGVFAGFACHMTRLTR